MSEPLTPEEERACLKLARQALEHYFKTGKPLHSPVKSGTLKEKRGAFVTLTVDGDLRGCIGYPLPVKPLDETIIEMAVAAASQDTRFEPLAARRVEPAEDRDLGLRPARARQRSRPGRGRPPRHHRLERFL